MSQKFARRISLTFVDSSRPSYTKGFIWIRNLRKFTERLLLLRGHPQPRKRVGENNIAQVIQKEGEKRKREGDKAKIWESIPLRDDKNQQSSTKSSTREGVNSCWRSTLT